MFYPLKEHDFRETPGRFRGLSASMRILFVTRDTFPPFRPAAAAIFKVELASRGHEIDWVLQSATPQPYSEQKFGGGTAYIGANTGGRSRWHRLRSNLQDLRNYIRVFKLMRVHNYDIVQIKDHYLPAVLVMIACKMYRVPYCYWLAYPHAEDSLYKAREVESRFPLYYLLRGYFWQWLLYKIILPNARHSFVQSEQMRLDVAGMGIPRESMTAVPGSLDLQSIPYDREPRIVPGLDQMGERDVVYLGTLSRVRHLDFLLRAFRRVAAREPSSRLFMLGKGNEPEDDRFLLSTAQELGIKDRVVFTGHLPMDIAWEYIRKSAVCVSPYYPTMILNSTSPTKLIEYMAMAKPTVGNDHPEQKLVIEQSASGVCVAYDEEAFAAAIVELLDNPEKARQMGLKGRSYVEKHRTNAVMADLVEKQYMNIRNDWSAEVRSH